MSQHLGSGLWRARLDRMRERVHSGSGRPVNPPVCPSPCAGLVPGVQGCGHPDGRLFLRMPWGAVVKVRAPSSPDGPKGGQHLRLVHTQDGTRRGLCCRRSGSWWTSGSQPQGQPSKAATFPPEAPLHARVRKGAAVPGVWAQRAGRALGRVPPLGSGVPGTARPIGKGAGDRGAAADSPAVSRCLPGSPPPPGRSPTHKDTPRNHTPVWSPSPPGATQSRLCPPAP